MLLSSEDVYVSVLLELNQRCEGPLQGSGGKVGFLLRCCNGKGPHLAGRGDSPGFSRVAAVNLGFISTYNGNLRDPPVLPQENEVSMRVARGLSRFFSSRCRGLGPHLDLRQEPQDSSPVLT